MTCYHEARDEVEGLLSQLLSCSRVTLIVFLQLLIDLVLEDLEAEATFDALEYARRVNIPRRTVKYMLTSRDEKTDSDQAVEVGWAIARLEPHYN
jgi:hypothetical protein